MITNYRGADIEPSPYGNGFMWSHENYLDASWEGDHWSSFGCGSGSTIEDCKEQIDEMFNELES